MIDTKAVTPFVVKAADPERRTFEGLASTWALDLGGDVIHKGAFADTLKEWRASGRIIPLLDQHNYWSVIRDRLGKLVDAKETDEGLWTQWKVFETTAGNDLLALLREGGVDGLSIGFNVTRADWEENAESEERRIRHIRAVDLLEVSTVHWGMNPGALIDLDSVKALLRDVDPTTLTDERRKDLRALASRIGSLLRPTMDPAVKTVAAPPVGTDAPTPPDASPAELKAPAADTLTASDPEPTYRYADALRQRLLGLKLKCATATTGV